MAQTGHKVRFLPGGQLYTEHRSQHLSQKPGKSGRSREDLGGPRHRAPGDRGQRHPRARPGWHGHQRRRASGGGWDELGTAWISNTRSPLPHLSSGKGHPKIPESSFKDQEVRGCSMPSTNSSPLAPRSRAGHWHRRHSGDTHWLRHRLGRLHGHYRPRRLVIKLIGVPTEVTKKRRRHLQKGSRGR